jgi:hypothetical protein
VRNLWRAPCVSLAEPSSHHPNPYMRVPETPPRTRAGFSFCADSRFALPNGRVFKRQESSPLFLLRGAFHSPGGATCRDNPEQAKTVHRAYKQ